MRWWPLLGMVFPTLLACGEELGPVRAPPQAFAGYDRETPVGREVVLDATLSSDPNGEALAFRWRLIARPETSTAAIAVGFGAVTSFVPDVPGPFVVHLEAFDGLLTGADLVTLTATETSTSS